MPRLFVARFQNGAPASMVRFVENFHRLGVRCQLPGWLERLEWSERKTNYMDGYTAYDIDLGTRVALFDNAGTNLVDGWVYEIVPDGRHVHYVAGGAWKHHADRRFTTNPTSTQTVDTVIKNTLTNYVAHIDSNLSNVVGSSSAVGNIYRVEDDYGSTPADLIETLLPYSDSSYRQYDYWTAAQPFTADGKLRYPLAYLAARETTPTAFWQVSVNELQNNRHQQSRHIWNLTTRVTVYYSVATVLTANAAAGATNLTVSSTTGFAQGNTVEVEMNSGGKHGSAIAAIVGNVITLNDPLPQAADSNKRVIKTLLTANTTAINSSAEASYWRVEYDSRQPEMNLTQANQYQTVYAGIYNQPITQNSITLVTPYLRDNKGALFPIWYLLRFPCYFKIIDLMPKFSLFSTSLNSIDSFFAVALDYDGYTMRVVPDTQDARLDAVLNQAGILPGTMVSRTSNTVFANNQRMWR